MSSAFEGKRAHRDQIGQGPIVPHLELTIGRAPQRGRRCRPCAAVCGCYYCQPSAAGRREWRHTEAGMDLIVNLIQREPESGPRLRALILVEKEMRLHARAVYCSEPLSAGLPEGASVLKLISEQSECGFVFPIHIEAVSSAKLNQSAAQSDSPHTIDQNPLDPENPS